MPMAMSTTTANRSASYWEPSGTPSAPNDRIAHRMYGKGLETWMGEPLTSSTVDIWSKRTPKMVIDKWYMVDDYHVDYGEGADFYSAGPSRGIGGSGLWANNQLYVSKNYIASRTLAKGPIRVLFELDYEPFDVNGVKVRELRAYSTSYRDVLLGPEAAAALRRGANVLAVHCRQTAGGQYIDAGLVVLRAKQPE